MSSDLRASRGRTGYVFGPLTLRFLEGFVDETHGVVD